MAGFGRIIQDESDIEIKNQMIKYMSDLMKDVQDFSWTSAKASHIVLLCQTEAGRVKWSDCHKIDRIRRANAQRAVENSNGTAGSFRDKPLISKYWCACYQNFLNQVSPLTRSDI